MWKNTGTNATAGGEFQDGNPGLGQPRSLLGATFLNMLLREAQNVVLDAGLALSAVDEHQLAKAIRLLGWPVGSVYTTTETGFDPNVIFGGTWVLFSAGRVLVGLDAGQAEFNAMLATGGAKTHTLTVPEIPGHTHRIFTNEDADAYGAPSLQSFPDRRPAVRQGGNDSDQEYQISPSNSDATEATLGQTSVTGGGTPHNNLQPYTVVRFWRRTA